MTRQVSANSIKKMPRQVLIRDTLSGELRPLEPREPGRVGIYACGPTVYSRIHIGNARPYVIFILLRRLLDRLGYEPRLVVNVTDINDKIYAAAREAGAPSDRFASEMIRAYLEDTDRLGLGRPDDEPVASETIPDIVALIEALIERGHAYESGGDVYFRVRSFHGYGKLSNRDPDEMDQGEEAGTESL
jgi:cysteinyl-tRNA synthetase